VKTREVYKDREKIKERRELRRTRKTGVCEQKRKIRVYRTNEACKAGQDKAMYPQI
jgi:hypothetical protein